MLKVLEFWDRTLSHGMASAIVLLVVLFSSADGLSPVADVECDEGMSLIQVARLVRDDDDTASAKSWNIDAALADTPRGSYLMLIHPVSYAVRLSYTATQGADHKATETNASIPHVFNGGGSWDRVPAAEVDPPEGLHAIVLRDNSTRRAIIAFRGLNLSPLENDRNRDADQCAVHVFEGKPLPPLCASFAPETLDYLTQGKNVVKRVQQLLPGFSILLTGHSLGASVATVLAATMKNGLRAVTFGLAQFVPTLVSKYGYSTKQLAALDPTHLIAIENPCDPAYLQGHYSNGGMWGSTVCTYNNAPPVEGCDECSAALRQDISQGAPGCLKSFLGAHVYKNYLQLVHSQDQHGRAMVPYCSVARNPEPKSEQH